MLQTRLRVGPQNDPSEREADSAAARIVAGGTAGALHAVAPAPQRMCAECQEEEETIQRQPVEEQEEEEQLQLKAEAGGPRAAGAEAAAGAVSGGGRPLSPALRSYFEPRFGRDFADVRVHTDASVDRAAEGIGARAYTLGHHIAFASGQYAPKRPDGVELLAHELAHVVQQRPGAAARVQRRVVDNDFHVPCRKTRADAVTTLQTAEGSAINVLRLAAVLIRLNVASYPIAASLGESSLLRRFRDIIWRRFHMDYNNAGVRNRFLPLLARRFELTASWIERLNHRYRCAAPGTEPPGECRTRPGEGIAWTASGINETQLCDTFWDDDADEQAGTILHEWMHFGFSWLGDCGGRNRNSAVCYEMVARELVGTATAADYAGCCAPPADPLPAFAGGP